ncbi:hypothetical protein CONPUDRAFT_169643 [Coniophora puteana RWD-64-598 SS2]|uniref:Uncharacterized protein n=1 Tax=Coniophora puteana (strain RWD-64-598) TaxID=741705 RepID=A0A5M3M7Q6_CONPW|nr:uncharacterized protein CONPUDRAFT_169643 [Coniophora puteana RWD-64-598 SS2]EIW75258.1 hypothetical protein CONPUDRAFT_169643 [Coniophora puteana RWD-64-598 SS2]
MGQYWRFLNLDRREHTRARGYRYKLGEFFGDGITNRNIALRLCRLRSLPNMPRIQPSGAESTNIERPGRSLLVLPNEILYHITDGIETLEDFACFAATCHICWDLCASTLEVSIKHMVSWAGSRIIRLGDYMQNDDLPAGILTEAQRAELDAAVPDESSQGRPVSLYEFAGDHYRSAVMSPDFFDITYAYIRPLEKRGIEGAPLAAIRKMCTPVEATVLRNLSKKLYVRADTIDELNKEVQPRCGGNEPFSLGEALVGRICWSSDPSCAMPEHCEDITRGPWAGDAFDITSMEIFQKEADLSRWVDAKDEVCEALRRYLDGY